MCCCRFPFFLVGAFVVDTYGKWEHLNPEGSSETFPERAIGVAGPVAQGMEPGRTLSQPRRAGEARGVAALLLGIVVLSCQEESHDFVVLLKKKIPSV